MKILLCLLPIFLFAKEIDLCKMAQDFVLEAKRIEISNYPHIFNPSIVRFKKSILFSFRIGEPNATAKKFGLVWLDDNFNPLGNPQIFDLAVYKQENPKSPRIQDPRLFTVGDRLYISFNHYQTKKMYLAELLYDGQRFKITAPKLLENFFTKKRNQLEKNWTPFAYRGQPHFIYIINPLIIFDPAMNIVSVSDEIPTWSWGEYSGGTPGLLIDGQYLSFFHSSKTMTSVQSNGKYMRHYFMGAFTFSANPPFNITGISKNPIIGKNFYTGPMYKRRGRAMRIIFPCGYIYDENYFWVAYGRQDYEAWVVKLKRNEVFNSIAPVL